MFSQSSMIQCWKEPWMCISIAIAREELKKKIPQSAISLEVERGRLPVGKQICGIFFSFFFLPNSFDDCLPESSGVVQRDWLRDLRIPSQAFFTPESFVASDFLFYFIFF